LGQTPGKLKLKSCFLAESVFFPEDAITFPVRNVFWEFSFCGSNLCLCSEPVLAIRLALRIETHNIMLKMLPFLQVAAGHNPHGAVEPGWVLPRSSFPAGQITSSAADMLVRKRLNFVHFFLSTMIIFIKTARDDHSEKLKNVRSLADLRPFHAGRWRAAALKRGDALNAYTHG
jgi:hypothetical protein